MTQTSAELDTERHVPHASGRLTWLRAAVLGANDGIVSVACIVVGVSAATVDRGSIFTAGLAGLAAGALSMAVGEYVSVSAQRDTERTLLAKERRELFETPEEELDELTAIYRAKGLTQDTARRVAVELTENDAFLAHAEAELGLDPDQLTNPTQAATSSAIAFTSGALIPLIAVLVPPAAERIAVTVAAVALALVLTGLVSAIVGDAKRSRAILRVTAGGMAAMAATSAIGSLVGHAVT